VPALKKKKLATSFLSQTDAVEHGMSVTDAILSLISTIIGGGIVGLPFAFYHCGIIFGICLLFVLAILTNRSCILMLKAKDLVPGDVE
jgi:amino acid permease